MTELNQPASQRAAKPRARKRLRIGIFGSGGNPWTTSHKILAEQARVQFDLDIVYLVTPGVGVDKELADKEMRWLLALDAAGGNEYFLWRRVWNWTAKASPSCRTLSRCSAASTPVPSCSSSSVRTALRPSRHGMRRAPSCAWPRFSSVRGTAARRPWKTNGLK